MKYKLLPVQILVWNKKNVWLLNRKSVEDTAKRRDTSIDEVLKTVDLGSDMRAYINPELLREIH